MGADGAFTTGGDFPTSTSFVNRPLINSTTYYFTVASRVT
jgi:hypothetical protein